MRTDPVVAENPALSDAIAKAVAIATTLWPERMRAAVAARYLGCARASFYRSFVKLADFPKCIRHSARFVTWSKTEIDQWLTKQKRSN
jgi:predicted DNA-binding transcriptional regulator AlpA